MLDMIRVKNKDLDCLNDNVNIFYIEKKYYYRYGKTMYFHKRSIKDLKDLQKSCFWDNLKELFDKMKYIAFVEVK